MAAPLPSDHRHNFPLPPLHHRPPPPPAELHSRSHTSHSVPMLLPVFILFFIIFTLLSLFLLRDIVYCISTTWLSGHRRRPGTGSGGPSLPAEAGQGLDPGILASFPTLPYSAVRGLQEGNCGRECAVCLSEFAAGDVVRLLTVCCHAFHQVCIDSWLAGHTTCPMCRSDLEVPPDEAAVLAVKEAVGGGGGGGGDSHLITVHDAAEQVTGR